MNKDFVMTLMVLDALLFCIVVAQSGAEGVDLRTKMAMGSLMCLFIYHLLP